MAQYEGDGDQVTGGSSSGNGHLDEATVHAWLDGQLSSEESARVEAHVTTCASCSAMVAEARGFVAASSRILSALDGMPARVVPRQRRRIQPWQLRAAAAVVVLALGTVAVLRRGGVPTELAKEQRSEVGGQKSEVHEQKSEVGGQKSEEQKSVVNGQRSDTAAQSATDRLRTAPRVAAVRSEPSSQAGAPDTPRRGAREELRKDMTGGMSNQLARAQSRQMADSRTGAVGGVAGAVGGEERARAAGGLQSAPQERNAPSSPGAALRDKAAPAPAPEAAPRRLSPAVDSIRLLMPRASATDSVGVAAKSAPGGVARGAAAAGASAPASAPAATNAYRADSLFARPPAATDEGYVPPARLQRRAVTRRITGRVVDSAAGTPIGGATIRVAGANGATFTSDSGTFNVLAPARSDTLIALRVGYAPRRVAVSELQRDTTIALVSAPLSLSQRVVDGGAMQNRRLIAGHVVDSALGIPIGGAVIRVEGTMLGIVTNDSGAFNVLAPASSDTLIAMHIGYVPRRVAVSERQEDITITLAASRLKLSEVVTTGHGVVRARKPLPTKAPGAQIGSPNTCVGRTYSRRDSAASDSAVRPLAGYRFDSTPSSDDRFRGFVLGAASGGGVVGSWIPVGRDSAVIVLRSAEGHIRIRVACPPATVR